jgi:hypothetical protein
MCRHCTTVLPRNLRAEFQANPINHRVILPDGSLAVVKLFHDTDQGRIYKVQGLHPNGRFRALGTLSCWYMSDELRLVYYTAGISPDWPRTRPGLN